MDEHPSSAFYVVGVGASAGGLEALETFFSHMPDDTDMAFVVIQHLSPDYESHMVHLLAKHTAMPVHEAQDGMLVKPNVIYLLPRRKNMTIFKGHLYLVDYIRERGLNMPIDIFFEALARDQGERAIGIILSGTGSDGTQGIRALKERGGMAMAQNETAKFDGMPRSAIATKLVDYIAAPELMPEKLLSYIQRPRLTTDASFTMPLASDSEQMGKLFAILHDQTGVDFTNYKPSTVIRRIERRMGINQIERLSHYVDYLQRSPEECQTLFKEFLIGVTSFFRDSEAFAILEEQVIPRLFEKRGRQDQLRVWVPGCATGEEAYSMAILFREYMEQSGQYVDVKIFATDVDKEALDYASQGIYSESVVRSISPDHLRNFFVKRGDSYEILRNLRSMVVFAHHNLVKDPPFSRIDLVSCRNLLIYLQSSLQRKVLATFEFALNKNGFLFLGSSETLGEHESLFRVESSKWRIYQYQGGTPPPLAEENREVQRTVGITAYRRPKKPDNWRNDEVIQSLIEQILPPCVVVDENNTILHAFGNLQNYLRFPTGYQVALDITKSIRSELALPLSTALHRARQNDETVEYYNIGLSEADKVTYVNLSIRLLRRGKNQSQFFLITIAPSSETVADSPSSEIFDLDQNAKQRIGHLEQELLHTQENLQATIEELETSNEELQATNQELMSANEELQSTNEELQSVNEELVTLNSEYQLKIEELTSLNDDISNLLSSIDVGTIFLDMNLNVRKFTPAAQFDINLLEQDVGRPFGHISHNFESLDLVKEAQRVLESRQATQLRARSRQKRWYLINLKPYLTQNYKVAGVLITLVDISEHQMVQITLQESERRFRKIFEEGPIAMAIVGFDYRFNRINEAFCELVGYDEQELKAMTFPDLTHPEDIDREIELARQLFAGEISDYVLDKRYLTKNGESVWVRLKASLTRNAEGVPLYGLMINENITQRKQLEEALSQTQAQLQTLLDRQEEQRGDE